MTHVSQRDRIMVLLVALVCVVLSLLILRPVIRKWREVSSTYALKKGELQQIQATLANEKELKKEYDDFIKAVKNPTGFTGVAAVRERVEQLRTDSGITIKSWTPREGPAEIAVDITTEARIESLVKFLYGVKTAPDLLDVTELKITPTPVDPAVLGGSVRVASLSVNVVR